MNAALWLRSGAQLCAARYLFVRKGRVSCSASTFGCLEMKPSSEYHVVLGALVELGLRDGKFWGRGLQRHSFSVRTIH